MSEIDLAALKALAEARSERTLCYEARRDGHMTLEMEETIERAARGEGGS